MTNKNNEICDPPPAKRARGDANTNSFKGTIQLTINNITDFIANRQEIESEKIEVQGIKWWLYVTANEKDGYLSAFVFGQHDASFWKCKPKLCITMLRLNGTTSEPYDGKCSEVIGSSPRTNNWGYTRCVELLKVLDESEGFVKDDTVKIKAEIEIPPESIRGIACDIFDEGVLDCADVAFDVEGRQVYVNKGYLSTLSAVFDKMFNGQFVENNKDVVPLDDLGADEFIEFLLAIYPTEKPVTAENVLTLVKLADRFDVPALTDKCESFLFGDTNVDLLEKLLTLDSIDSSTNLKYTIIDNASAEHIKNVIKSGKITTLDTLEALAKKYVALRP
jgi:hypothetical protein